MKRITAISAIGLFSILLVSCVDKTSNPPIDDGVIAVNDTVWLEYGEKKTLQPGNLEIGFDQVIEETRCPYEYICREMGQGIIRLWLKRPGMDTVFINVGIKGFHFFPNEQLYIPADTLDLRFLMLGLYPYPVNMEPIPQANYAAQIEITQFINRISQVEKVIITDIPPDSIELDPFELSAIHIQGDTLKLRINYSGGCEEHDFAMYMSPSTFAESYPAQADLYLGHNANDDVCRAYIQRDLAFDLSPIGVKYYEFYGGLDTIRIFVHYYKNEFGNGLSGYYYPVDSL